MITKKLWESRTRKAIEQKGDPDCAMAMQLDATDVAILYRKRGEALPADPAIQEKWLKERRELFRYLPLQYLLDARFFLIGILKQLAARENIDHFLIQKLQHSLGTQKSKKAKGSNTRGKRRLRKKSGTTSGRKRTSSKR